MHDAYLQLVDQRTVQWQSRAHFFGIAAHLICRILVEYARRRAAGKRGGHDAIRVPLDPELAALQPRDIAVVAIDDALNALSRVDPQQSRSVELRSFGGLTVEQTADVLGISPRTLKRDWRMARAWLQRELESGNGNGPGNIISELERWGVVVKRSPPERGIRLLTHPAEGSCFP